MSYTPVKLQQFDPETEEWHDVKVLHALQINTAGGSENFESGAEQYHIRLKFRFAYTKLVERVRFAPQHYQLVYNGQLFNIIGFDDYMEQHLYANITGEAYG